jgi:hypothetical protein
MSFWDWLWICGAFSISAAFAVASALHFAGKGFLLNSAYFLATPEERAELNKKPYYRQSAVVFALLCAAFAFIGLYMIFRAPWCMVGESVCLIATGVYAVASGIAIRKNSRGGE